MDDGAVLRLSCGWRTRAFALVLLLAAVPLRAADDPPGLERRLAQATGAERLEVLIKLSEAHLYRAPDKVVARAQEAYEVARSLRRPREAAQAILLRATGHFQLGDLDRALADYGQCLKDAEPLADHLLLGGGLNGVAAVQMKRGQLDAALASFTAAVAHLHQAGNKEKLAGSYNNISLIYYSKGQYNQALDYMSKALDLYTEVGRLDGQGVVLNAIGNVYSKLADPVRARDHFERALAIAEKTGHKALMVGCLVNIGEIHGRQREWDLALAFLTRALPVARELGSRDYLFVCLNNIGDVLREQGKNAQALTYYFESLKISEAMNARPRIVASYLNIGRLYVASGRVGDGETYLRKAFDLAREVEERSLQKDAAEQLYSLYEKRGDYRAALVYQRAFDTLREHLFSKENFEKVSTLQARLENEKKQREIDLLKKEGEVREQKVKRQRLAIAYVATALVLLAAVAFVLYARYTLKVRSNAELSVAYARMAELASQDALTGLHNRRAATDRLAIEVVRSTRTGRPFALVMIDIDFFKKINDEYGHECGDAVLRHLADLLRASVRDVDVVARWGGEEFLLILPETTRDGALVLAEKVRDAIRHTSLAHGDTEIRVTATLGLSVFDDRVGLDACIRAADEALYEGKRAGRDTIVAAPRT